ncbi:MAG: DUF2779 domain-containing protein [Candidatus Omnitrophica bacterium]|nr:DUF2779 domain-containing protein [Candidatus Omnitrophota bacterium]
MDDDFELSKVTSDLVYDSLQDSRKVKDFKILTKSKFLNGLQCPKLLWTRCSDPLYIPPPAVSLQRVFDIGHEVGILARKRFPGGAHVQEEDFGKNLQETKSLLADPNPKPIYEAGIKAGRLYARADILVPSSTIGGAWDVVEVKCGTDCKEVYLQDIAFQRYCYEQAGIRIDRCYMMYINNQYVKRGAIDPEQFFSLLDVTEEIIPFVEDTPALIDGFLKIIDMPACPNISIREHCGQPYECQMKPLCWQFLPKFNVVELSRGKAKGFDLLDQGIMRLKDIPSGFKLTDKQQIQVACAISGDPHIDISAIAGFLGMVNYPVCHMDFETIFEAIPRFDGTRPYQQIPFQFSVHIQESPGAVPAHFEFLHKGADDPRPALAKALKACLSLDGTILAWNKGFEEGRIKELAVAYPEYAEWSADVLALTEDLIVPFRSFHYYHPDQHGSASLKKVLPAFIGKGYAGMTIADGGQATTEYIRVTYRKDVDSVDRAQVYADLKAYCGLDTSAMVEILERLRALSNLGDKP